MRIAITGGMGSGKSMVSSILRQQGWKVLDADQIVDDFYHDPVIIDFLTSLFGSAILKHEGLDKAELGKQLFKDKAKLKRVQDRIYPLVKETLVQAMDQSEEELIFAEVPLLYEANFDELFDYCVLVDAPLDLRLERLQDYRQIEASEALRRINMQMSSEEKRLRADFILENDASLNHLKEIVYDMVKQLRRKADDR